MPQTIEDFDAEIESLQRAVEEQVRRKAQALEAIAAKAAQRALHASAGPPSTSRVVQFEDETLSN